MKSVPGLRRGGKCIYEQIRGPQSISFCHGGRHHLSLRIWHVSVIQYFRFNQVCSRMKQIAHVSWFVQSMTNHVAHSQAIAAIFYFEGPTYLCKQTVSIPLFYKLVTMFPPDQLYSELLSPFSYVCCLFAKQSKHKRRKEVDRLFLSISCGFWTSFDRR